MYLTAYYLEFCPFLKQGNTVGIENPCGAKTLPFKIKYSNQQGVPDGTNILYANSWLTIGCTLRHIKLYACFASLGICVPCKSRERL